jgi:hypothetical protein
VPALSASWPTPKHTQQHNAPPPYDGTRTTMRPPTHVPPRSRALANRCTAVLPSRNALQQQHHTHLSRSSARCAPRAALCRNRWCRRAATDAPTAAAAGTATATTDAEAGQECQGAGLPGGRHLGGERARSASWLVGLLLAADSLAQTRRRIGSTTTTHHHRPHSCACAPTTLCRPSTGAPTRPPCSPT